LIKLKTKSKTKPKTNPVRSGLRDGIFAVAAGFHLIFWYVVCKGPFPSFHNPTIIEMCRRLTKLWRGGKKRRAE